MVYRPPQKPVTYARKPRQKRKEDVYNLLSGLLFLLSFCFISWFVYLFNIPNSILNPLPPNRPSEPVVFEDSSPSPEIATLTRTQTDALETTKPVAPTSTISAPTATREIAFSQTVAPSSTVSVTFTATQEPAQTVTTAPKGYYSYHVMGVPPVTYIQASVMNPGRGCEWTGIGGQVLDIQHRPAPGIMIQLGGAIGGNEVLKTSLSGVATQYGAAGYEFTLNIDPTDSKQGLWVRLVDQGMNPISDQVYFDTYSECKQNLVLINFQQVK